MTWELNNVSKEKFYQIAIDGPAGSGKSTIAKNIAKKIEFLYIDSGAMYRAVTLYMIKNKLFNKSNSNLMKQIKRIKIRFVKKNKHEFVFLNDKNVTKEIRSSAVNKLVSEVSSKRIVRTEMVARQRKYAQNTSVVMDGRDIGTVVFPDANLKIYLTASPLIRAIRRRKDLKKIAEHISVKDLEKEICYRDNYDSSRAISPLCMPHDAIVIDSSGLTINETLDRIFSFLPMAFV